MHDTHDEHDEASFSTPANQRSTLDPNKFQHILQATEDLNMFYDMLSPPDNATKSTGSFSDVVRLDINLRHQRETAEKEIDQAKRIAHDIFIPDEFPQQSQHHHQQQQQQGPSSTVFANLCLRPSRTPFRQISCALCALESMETPPQNSTNLLVAQCTCGGHDGPVARFPSLPVSLAPCASFPHGETFLVGTPLELTLDSDLEDYGNDRSKRFLLKPQIRDTRSKSASPTRSGFVTDETDYLPLIPRFHRNRCRPVRRSLDCSALPDRTVPQVPLATPENSRSVWQATSSEAPFDLPMLPYTPKESPGFQKT